jgi:hypothetical protein
MRPLINISDGQYWQQKKSQPFTLKASRDSLSILNFNSSVDAQIELHSLHNYVDSCQESIRDIRMEIEFLSGQASNNEILVRIGKKLGKICLDTDGWQFDDLYQIACAVQRQLLDLELGIQKWGGPLAKAIDEGLTMLSVLLEECENDFLRRLSVNDFLMHLSQPA